jgi:hypothetical protein
MRSPKGSDLGLLDLERDLPTTVEDVAALRRLRREQERSFLFDDWSVLQPIAGLPIAEDRRRATSAGWEPFEL